MRYKYGVFGICMAYNLTMIIQFLVASIYLRINRETKLALQPMDWNILSGIWTYTKVGIPVTIMVWFDRWSLFILTAMAAFLGVE